MRIIDKEVVQTTSMLRFFAMKLLKEISEAIPTLLETSLVRPHMTSFGALSLNGAKVKLMLAVRWTCPSSVSLATNKSEIILESYMSSYQRTFWETITSPTSQRWQTLRIRQTMWLLSHLLSQTLLQCQKLLKLTKQYSKPFWRTFSRWSVSFYLRVTLSKLT